jgi:HTH-type transcriptional regulator/antitoxin HigA
MKPKIIKNESEYEAALAKIEQLMDLPDSSSEKDDLEVFALLVEEYEKKHYPIEFPDPVEAILFRMEQQGLSRRDLEKYIGSQSKVSEVLNHKIPLSISMIRALNKGLGIPFEILLQESGKEKNTHQYDLRKFPFAEMVKNGYFRGFAGTLGDAKLKSDELIANLLSVFKNNPPHRVFCRSSAGKPDDNALLAWQAHVIEIALENKLPPYDPASFSSENVHDIIKLSGLDEGPLLAKEYLEQRGIAMVVLSHLPNTYLDGASFISPSGTPIIGMTLRHDRLDNFWFTLVHELTHLLLHCRGDNVAFFDELIQGISDDCDSQEIEANKVSSDLMIPLALWKKEKDYLLTKKRIVGFSRSLGISPAIVAGRLRWENNDYKSFNELIGSKQVKILFQDGNN